MTPIWRESSHTILKGCICFNKEQGSSASSHRTIRPMNAGVRQRKGENEIIQ